MLKLHSYLKTPIQSLLGTRKYLVDLYSMSRYYPLQRKQDMWQMIKSICVYSPTLLAKGSYKLVNQGDVLDRISKFFIKRLGSWYGESLPGVVDLW